MKRHPVHGMTAVLGLLLTAGCAASTPPPRPVYQHVPCATPGAREEVPISLEKDPVSGAGTPSDEKQAGAAPQAGGSPRCVKEVR